MSDLDSTGNSGGALERLTKSRYLIARQCPRRLWLIGQGTPEPPVEPEEVWEDREAEGAAVEAQAARLFPGAARIVDADDDDSALESSDSFSTCVDLTSTVLADPSCPAILQAHLVSPSGSLACVVDVLERRDDGSFFVWEVKASTKVVPLHLYDVAFQVVVAREAGLAVSGGGVIHLDRSYRRGADGTGGSGGSGGTGGIDPTALLTRVDLTTEVLALVPTVEAEIPAHLGVLARDSLPLAHPGVRCKGSRGVAAADRPSDCGHLLPTGVCGAALPEWWVGRLPRIDANRLEQLREHGVSDLRTLAPDDPRYSFSDRQQRAIEDARSGTPWVDPVALRALLSRIVHPVAAIDFEFDPGMAVPRWVGYRPYDSVPFQWSMHVRAAPGAPLEPWQFLHETADDPTRPFLTTLFEALPDEGSVLVHHRSAEARVLREAAARLGGDWPERVEELIARFIDTEVIVKDGYHHPEMLGSTSLKTVAPALVGTGFEDLEIQHGMAAVTGWRDLLAAGDGGDEEERARLREALIAYCGRDTELLFWIIARLGTLAG